MNKQTIIISIVIAYTCIYVPIIDTIFPLIWNFFNRETTGSESILGYGMVSSIDLIPGWFIPIILSFIIKNKIIKIIGIIAGSIYIIYRTIITTYYRYSLYLIGN